MEGDCNVYAHSSLWMRPTGEWSINAKMVYSGIQMNVLTSIVDKPTDYKMLKFLEEVNWSSLCLSSHLYALK